MIRGLQGGSYSLFMKIFAFGELKMHNLRSFFRFVSVYDLGVAKGQCLFA